MRTLFSFFSVVFLFCCSAEQRHQANNTHLRENELTTSEAQSITKDTFTVPLAYLMGQFEPETHPDFTLIDRKYADRAGMYLRTDAYKDFQRMWEAARIDGVTLVIRSATRNFNSQKSIWEAKWTGQRRIEGGQDASVAFPDPVTRARMILKFSSMPGSSRHHWGTDIDLNNLTNAYFDQGEGKKIYDWLTAHAAEYGFCQPYTEKGPDRPHGYNEERWHWSYMPVSRPLTAQAERELTNDMITGFLGSEVASEVKAVEHYVLGINAECRLR